MGHIEVLPPTRGKTYNSRRTNNKGERHTFRVLRANVTVLIEEKPHESGIRATLPRDNRESAEASMEAPRLCALWLRIHDARERRKL